MKPNRVRRLLAEGKAPIGHMLMEFATRGMAKITQRADLDFVLIDMEHSGFDFGQVNDLLSWYKATPVTPFVRVPSSDYDFIARVMDAGAKGVMVPNVKTPEQAKQVVDAVRYAPEGDRGLGLGLAHNDFVRPNPREYMAAANREPGLADLIPATGAALLGAGAATGEDVLTIVGAVALALGFVLSGFVRHVKVDYAIYDRLNALESDEESGRLAGRRLPRQTSGCGGERARADRASRNFG